MFEHVRDAVSVGVDANPSDSRIELEPGYLLALQFPHDDRAPMLELRRGAPRAAVAATTQRLKMVPDVPTTRSKPTAVIWSQ